MNPKRFTAEQIRFLKQNPYTAYVSDSVIKFTLDFKIRLAEAINNGERIRSFIQETGYDYDMLGEDRINAVVSRMRKELRAGNTPRAVNKKRKSHPDLSDYKSMTAEDAMIHMQNEILYLHQELDFIKKIIELDKAGGQKK